jgi:hypothetical protein
MNSKSLQVSCEVERRFRCSEEESMWRRLPGRARTLWVQVMWVLSGRCERMGLVDSKMQERSGIR